MQILKMANLALAFLLELCLLVALGYWGYHSGQGTLARWGLTIGAPLVLAVVWGAFLAPKSAVALPQRAKLALKFAAFGLGALALAAAGQTTLAVALIVVAAINLGLAVIWGQ